MCWGTSIGQPDEVGDGGKRALGVLHGGRWRWSGVSVRSGLISGVVTRYRRSHSWRGENGVETSAAGGLDAEPAGSVS